MPIIWFQPFDNDSLVWMDELDIDVVKLFPQNKNLNIYNRIPVHKSFGEKLRNFTITIKPEILMQNDININGRIEKICIFTAIDKFNNKKEISLLGSSLYYIRWHFLKFLQLHGLQSQQFGVQPGLTCEQYETCFLNNLHQIINNFPYNNSLQQLNYPSIVSFRVT